MENLPPQSIDRNACFCYISDAKTLRLHRLTVRTLGSHPGNRSSILRGVTKNTHAFGQAYFCVRAILPYPSVFRANASSPSSVVPAASRVSARQAIAALCSSSDNAGSSRARRMTMPSVVSTSSSIFCNMMSFSISVSIDQPHTTNQLACVHSYAVPVAPCPGRGQRSTGVVLYWC